MCNKKPSVLFVDDDDDTLAMLSTLATNTRKFEVHCASTAIEAIEMFNERCEEGGPCFDALVLDVDLPMMSGVSIAKRVLEKYPGVPILFLTAYAEGDTRKLIEELDKPFEEKPINDPAAFLEKIERLCRQGMRSHAGMHGTHRGNIKLPEVASEMFERYETAKNIH